ncbi:GPI mannosyltransferase 2 [Solanum tuberosum]|uniref:GPI mannosyltransferase 2 n=4 Tax=Solanum tuberosum TaxID=4113 RepID=M1D556_SOLTU|nr:PREDICTED: GPI mannosyltransferase 2 [Solanum tuberosum]XP_006354158.1 PREDICTED: GPI mannosyltransferase 2 [Solanum tuberosum]XP_015167158.1 PREDICTED: GPI mannosyltransferase 2 [Solanum tuberosum]
MAGKSTADLHYNHTRLVLKYAVISRLVLISLIVLWRSMLSPYDTSGSINPSCLSNTTSIIGLFSGSNFYSKPDSPPFLLPRLASVIEDSIVWDSVYFVRIAQCGYEYEQNYAFFPLIPICISLLSRTVLAPLIPFIGQRAVLGLSGYVLNNFAFVLASFYLYRLSAIILKDSEVALRATILFCLNPASIFYSSIYTESMYALCSIGGLYYLMRGSNNIATLWLALTGFARSNGVLNAGYICFQTMHRSYKAAFVRKNAGGTLLVLLSGALRSLFIISPFIAFQAYGYYNMCVGGTSDEMRPWCKARLPLLYNYIQSRYWGVGFLKYFQVKQIPNFVLASPILSLALCTIIHYVKLWPEVFVSLGFRESSPNKESAASSMPLGRSAGSKSVGFPSENRSDAGQGDSLRRRKLAVREENYVVQPSEDEASENPGFKPIILVPFILHLVFMVATAFFVMHVQVSTRFLSASPPLYWFGSYVMASPRLSKRWGYIIWTYCAAYILLGSLLFSNFYPFT